MTTQKNTFEGYPLDICRSLLLPDCDKFLDELTSRLKMSGQTDKNRAALAVLVGNLLHCHQHTHESWIGVSRDNGAYPTRSMYNPLNVSARKIREASDRLTDTKFTEFTIGFYDKNSKQGRTSKIRATGNLIELANHHGAYPNKSKHHKNREIIILKDKDKKLVEYTQNKNTNLMRDDLEKWNKFMSDHAVDLHLSSNEIASDSYLKTIDFTKTNLYRVFNNSCFNEGGRFYGHWLQEIQSKYRSLAVIDAKATIEVDWSGLHPAMLYAISGLPLPKEDLYTLDNPSISRGELKTILLIMLNTKSKKAAIATINNKIKEGEFSSFETKTVLEAFELKHSQISSYFYRAVALSLQFKDSEMIRHIMKRFLRERVPMIPIHDSIITWKSCEHIAKEAMTEAVIDMLSKEKPTIGKLETVLDDYDGWIKVFDGPSIRTKSSFRQSLHSDGEIDISAISSDDLESRLDVRNRVSKRIERH